MISLLSKIGCCLYACEFAFELYIIELISHMEHQEWKSYSPNDIGAVGNYNLAISAIVPRPVAVITSIPNAVELSTHDVQGHGDSYAEYSSHHYLTKEEKTPGGEDRNEQQRMVVNCAPFSYTGLLSHDPPMVAHGICLKKSKDGATRQKKDTLVNIEKSREWVYNVLSEPYLDQANGCSENLPYGVSEVRKNNLSTLPSKKCKTPRLAQAMVSMECVLDSTKEIYNDKGEHTTTIVMGKIVEYHIHSSVLKDNGNGTRTETAPVVDLTQLQPVGRAGDITYWPAGADGSAVSMKRP